MVDLLYCANQGVFDGVLLSLMSCVKKASCPIHAYLITMDLSEYNEKFTPITKEQVNLINQVIQQENSQNQVHLLDATKVFLDKMGMSPNIETGYTPYTLLRLLATEFDLPEQILYVDADTMFCKDINIITHYDISHYELAGVLDHLGQKFIAKDYLNAGVLYLNLKRIRETGLFERAITLCLTKKMVFPDQDALNELTKEKLILPESMNEQHKWKSETVIQHFSKTIYFWPMLRVVNIKQWQIELVWQVLKLHVYDEVYQDYIRVREGIGKEIMGPRQILQPITTIQQLKINIAEVMSYIHQNGGIFRENKEVSQ